MTQDGGRAEGGIGIQPRRALSVVAIRVSVHGDRNRPTQVGHSSIIPEASESVGRHGGVAHGMLNVLMPQIILNDPGIMPLRRQVIAARMPELVRMGTKGSPATWPVRATMARIDRGDRGALRSETNT